MSRYDAWAMNGWNRSGKLSLEGAQISLQGRQFKRSFVVDVVATNGPKKFILSIKRREARRLALELLAIAGVEPDQKGAP